MACSRGIYCTHVSETLGNIYIEIGEGADTKKPLFLLADEAVLRIRFKGNSIQEDDTLSKLAYEFDFNKVEKLLA